jgi:hypothetical protein
MRNGVIAALLVVVILAGAGVGYLIGESNLQNRTLTSTTTETITTASSITSVVTTTTFYPDLGSHLQLRIEMNASAILPEGAIRAQVILSNPLDSNLTAIVPESSNSTVSNWNEYDFLCGGASLNSVVGFALFQGHYVPENLSLAGEPLTLAPPLLPPCATYPAPLFLVYLPSGSNAWAYSSYPQVPPFMVQTILNATTVICSTGDSGGTTCGPSSGLFGYWQGPVSGPMGNYTTSSPDFHYFSPGQYTLVAEDAWGHQAFAYFEVT